ncbi:DUF2207 domain-containing protein [Gordonia shandongensis]|uniref:DUF2207 domain-containing protein n=1 Tax=Gordonia shandongensis TaxID=376351 RepID=UPI0004211BD1|nr:DUF2207 domain-containing protein [Gordonia shandongensis]
MQRIFLTVIAALATLVGVFWPLVGGSQSSSSDTVDPVTVTSYRADYRLDTEGTLRATETLTTSFPGGRHGIFRFWDVTDGATGATGENRGVRYRPRDISVTMDGATVPVEMSTEDGGRVEVARIGDADRYVMPGEHEYTISYTIDGAIAADPSRFVWRVVPNGWTMPIRESTSTIHFPEAPTEFRCTTNDAGPCRVSEPDPLTRVVTTGALSPGKGVAVRADLPFAAPERSTVPWSVAFDRVFGRSVTPLVIVLVASIATFAAGFVLMWRSRERSPLLPVMYEPPADPQNPGRPLGPVQTYYVEYEALPDKALLSTIFHLADRKHVVLDRDEDGTWTVTSQLTGEDFGALDPAQRAVVAALGLAQSGAVFRADRSAAAGKRLSTASTELSAVTRQWGLASGTLMRSGTELFSRAAVVGSIALAAIGMITSVLPGTALALPFAAFAVGGAGLFARGVGTRRTRLGREVWSRAGGFERLLSTPSNRDRLDFSARTELYTSYIPYAMAFDCADAWAAKYRYVTGHEPPEPDWFGPAYYLSVASYGAFGSGSGFDSFSSSVSSAISAYSASQSSSSGGGGFGGGFGGGGGGGGGGGSW